MLTLIDGQNLLQAHWVGIDWLQVYHYRRYCTIIAAMYPPIHDVRTPASSPVV